ncbi:hypothetical protein V6N12_014436 [Hibiscus sabdariffa]|uniref:Uncharacterized protein n=1 Tax=Hibiscus sabdariffa TaxID=183260 RepID=A0ABR2DK60_9ROSI
MEWKGYWGVTCSLSGVTPVCNPSGGIRVIGLWFDGSGSLCLESGLSVPSQELGYVTPAKARVSWLLEREALREAGFTEQRLLPFLGSGRITGC